MSEKENWIVIDLAMESDLLATLIDNLYIRANTATQKMFVSIR
ncbi:hypothetical protein C5L18_000477 [Lactobacillus amylolyticus]|nr:hypothetical protein C5L18_000477 [Lactobacillus amylolyticus]